MMLLCVVLCFLFVGRSRYKNIYASEFGTGGSSSFESMSGTLSPQHWGLHAGMPADNCSDNGDGRTDQPMGPCKCLGQHECHAHGEATGVGKNPMTQRNYACDGQIRLFFGNHTTVDLNATGEAAFKGQMYRLPFIYFHNKIMMQTVFLGNREL